MVVGLEGIVGEDGMVLDFGDLKAIVKPLVDAWDHALFVSHDDELLRDIVRQTDWKVFRFPYPSTAERIACYAADYVCGHGVEMLQAAGVTEVWVEVQETETSTAVYSRHLSTESQTPAESLHLDLAAVTAAEL